jgi:hypothetical protein
MLTSAVQLRMNKKRKEAFRRTIGLASAKTGHCDIAVAAGSGTSVSCESWPPWYQSTGGGLIQLQASKARAGRGRSDWLNHSLIRRDNDATLHH